MRRCANYTAKHSRALDANVNVIAAGKKSRQGRIHPIRGHGNNPNREHPAGAERSTEFKVRWLNEKDVREDIVDGPDLAALFRGEMPGQSSDGALDSAMDAMASAMGVAGDVQAAESAVRAVLGGGGVGDGGGQIGAGAGVGVGAGPGAGAGAGVRLVPVG